MTGDPKVFHEYKLSSGKERVSLADGSSISVAGKGSLPLLNKFLVHNALHVPHLPLNLLSVSKITKELNCELIFSANHCVLQDLVTGTRIEIGLASDGLYRLPLHVAYALLTATAKPQCGHEEEKRSVIRWHKRLGQNEDAEKYVYRVDEEGLLCNVYAYNLLIGILSKAKDMDKASKIFMTCKEGRGFTPNLISSNRDGARIFSRPNQGRARLLKLLLEHRLKLDIFTFSSIIEGLCRNHQLEDALDCFSEMVEWGVFPNEVTYNIIIRSLCNVGQVGRSLQLLQKQLSDGITPDVFSFNALILSLCRMKNLEKATDLFHSMSRYGVTPDSYTYNAFIKALCDSGKLDEAKTVLIVMGQNGCSPNSHSYCPIIDALSHKKCFEEAQEFIQICRKRYSCEVMKSSCSLNSNS